MDVNGVVLPTIDPHTGAYRPGSRAIDYRSEPFMDRLNFAEDQKSESLAHVRDQQAKIMCEASPMIAWPDVPTHVVAAADDRLFPLPFMRAQAADRLRLEPAVIPGGHLAPLTQPAALAHQLDRFATATP